MKSGPSQLIEPDGRITAKGHSRRGSHWVRERLYREGLGLEPREAIAALVTEQQNLEEVAVSYYEMDVEFLFSTSPFAQPHWNTATVAP